MENELKKLLERVKDIENELRCPSVNSWLTKDDIIDVLHEVCKYGKHGNITNKGNVSQKLERIYCDIDSIIDDLDDVRGDIDTLTEEL